MSKIIKFVGAYHPDFSLAHGKQHLDKPERNYGPKRILILMSDTGGGHRAAAQAIQEALLHLYGPAVTVSIVDAWKHHVAWPINRLSGSYGWILNEAIWLWKSFWLLKHQPELVDTLLKPAYPLVVPGLLKLFKTYRPDVIVSVHPLITLFPLMALRQARLNIPFVTVVTDLVGGYPTWYQPQTTLCLVPTEATRVQALSLGLSPKKVQVVGQPVPLKFTQKAGDKGQLRHKLGLDPTRPTALLVGGGEGYGPVFEIARCLAQKVPQAQLLLVAGRNNTLRQKLTQTTWEIPTTIFGFVDNMPELMRAADVFITKAGPGSLAEAFITGLPIILYGYIPGQEEGNVHYVQAHRAGVYLPNPLDIATFLADWFQPDSPTLTELAGNATRLSRPEASLAIARRIYALIP